MTGKLGIFGFIVYLLFGFYLINFTFNFVSLPDFIQSIHKILLFIAGVLVIVGGINHLRAKRNRYDKHSYKEIPSNLK